MPGIGSVPKIRTDLAYFGVVTQVVSTTQFVAAGLAGLGNGALSGYAAYVMKKADGTTTAPHGEQPAISAYVSASGTFTHTAYTTGLAVGDQLLLMHPNISTSIASILAAVGTANPYQGLVYYGIVTDVPAANQFTIASLAGLGAGKFIDLGLVYQYYAFVFRDAGGGGAAPQGEAQAITNYATATGNFTAGAFTVPVAVGDEILIIHPYLARLMHFAGLPPVTGTTTENWQAAEADIVSIGVDNVAYKVNSLLVDINALVGTVTIRMYMEVTGVERLVYEQDFTVAGDTPGLWIVNGPVGIHEVLRVTAESDNAADNGQSINYDYMIEEM